MAGTQSQGRPRGQPSAQGGEHLGAEFTRRLPLAPITGANPEALPKGLAFFFFKTNFIRNQW